jgi:ATP-dependent RNA helicase RhlB
VKFSEIQLHPKLQANLDKIGFVDCTQIQEQAIPLIRKGKDLAGLAQTGTGKTGAFLLPLIDRLLKGIDPDPATAESETVPFTEWKKKQYCLVLVPTRELCEQVQENAEKFLAGTGFKSVSIYGGTTYEKQVAALKEGVEFVIATPGRFIDLYKEHVADLGLVRAVAFDEADRMFDMGFKDDMKFILRRIPRERQFLVFSATLNFDVLNTAYEFGADPVEVNISRDQAKAENVKDMIMHIGQEDKPKYLLSILKKFEPRQTIIFSNFKHNVEKITQFLNNNNVPAVGISSLLTQAQRNRVMAQFKAENDRNIMVATDVAARGLDILGVDMVINYELPDDPENYVHRIGRTGRAGQTGQAFSMVSDRDVDALQRIEEYLKHKVENLWMEETELVTDFQPFPRDEGRFRGPRQGGGGRGFEKRGEGGRGGGRDRGGRGGGRDRDRNRGPRRDDRGPRRDDRGPRPQHAAGEGGEQQPQQQQQHRDRQRGRHQGDRPHGEGQHQGNGRPPRDQQQRHGQGRGGQGQHQGGQRHGGGQQGRRDNRGPRDQQRHGGGGHQGPRHGQRHGQGPRHQGGARPNPVVAQKGIGQKVTGFIKRLFGKES